MAYTPGQKLPASQLNASFGAKADQTALNSVAVTAASAKAVTDAIVSATAPDAGALNGSEVTTISRGAGILSTTLSGLGAWIVQTLAAFTQIATGTVPRSIQDKARESLSVLDFNAPTNGVTSADAAFAAAGAWSVSSGQPVVVPAPYTFVLNNSNNTGGSFIIEKGATVTEQSIPSSPGTGGGNLAFFKSRLTQAPLYGNEEIDTFSAAYGRNILPNPYGSIWPDLDVFGGTAVAAPCPTLGDASTYSGTGGLRVYGPAGWWTKVWGGAIDPTDLVTHPGAGTSTLTRIRRQADGGTMGEAPWYIDWEFTGFNPKGAQYQDPVIPAGMDTGTNSVEIASVVRGARRTGKFTFRFRMAYISGDTQFNVRLVYSFGTGGSPSPNAQVNMQGFTADTSGNMTDYVCMFEVPPFTVDANGNPIVFGTNDDDYVQLTITSGANGNFKYRIAVLGELRPGWGFAQYEYRPIAMEQDRADYEYQILKVGAGGGSTNGAQMVTPVGLRKQMRDNPTLSFRSVVFNASNVARMGVSSITVTSNGFGYTSAPSVAITGGGGSGATATAVLDTVSFIQVTNSGSGYTVAPNVVIGGPGTGAAATATISGGVVQYITITNKGTGYTSVPSISFSGGGGGAGAAATAYLGIGNTLTVTAPGSLYTTVPTVSITGGGGKGAAGVAVLDPTMISGDKVGFLFGVLAAATQTGARFIGYVIANGRRVKS